MNPIKDVTAEDLVTVMYDLEASVELPSNFSPSTLAYMAWDICGLLAIEDVNIDRTDERYNRFMNYICNVLGLAFGSIE